MVEECVKGFRDAARKKGHREEHTLDRVGSFHEWILATFGSGMSKYFFIPYNEKFWKFPLSQMNHQWMRKLIPQPSLNEVVEGATGEQKKEFGYNMHFAYPLKGGIASLPQAFGSRLKDISIGKEAIAISLKEREITFRDGLKAQYDQLISTIPLSELIRIINDVPASIKDAAGGLNFTSLLNVNLGVNARGISDRHWIYFPGPEFIFHRVGFPSNFSSHLAPEGRSSLYVEVSYPGSEAPFTGGDRGIGAGRIKEEDNNLLQSRYDKIVEQVIRGLIEAGVLESEDQIIVKEVVDTKYAYPILSKDYDERISLIQSFLRENDILSLGRFGSWRYLTMEEAILNGKQIAEEIASHPHLNPAP